MHKIDDFKSEVNQHLPRAGKTATGMFAKWLLDIGFQLYQDAFRQETGTDPSRSPDLQLVEQAFSRGLDDAARKRQQSAFFSANAAIFLRTGTMIADGLFKADSHPMVMASEPQHAGLLKKLVLDAEWLLEEWASAKEGITGVFGIYKNRHHHPLQISHAVEQLYFGGSRFMTTPDNASESSIAVLRVALETRLRWGFGVLGRLRKSDGAFQPLGMASLFEAIKSHQASITLDVPAANLSRIYKWTNTYMHAGIKDYIWLPHFAAQYLNGFLRGGSQAGGFNANAGIITDRATILALQGEIESAMDLTKVKLLKCSPEDCDAVLR